LAGAENLIIMLLFLRAVITIIRDYPVSFPVEVVLMILYILILAGIIGLSTPNIGSLSRYRVVFLPFLLFLLLLANFKLNLNRHANNSR
jgi:hypothetical protein